MKKMQGLKTTAWAKHKRNANKDFGGQKNGYNRQIRRNIKKTL